MSTHDIYGLGNPIIDLNFQVTDGELEKLGRNKGIMHLVAKSEQEDLLKGLGRKPLGYSAGGDVPNVMVTSSLIGAKSVLSGKIGVDEFGALYEERVKDTGVTSALKKGTGLTASSIIMVSPDGERTMNTYLGMCQEFGPSDLDEELLKDSKIFFVSGYFWDTPNQKAAVQKAIKIATESNKIIAFDLADPFAVNRSRVDFEELLMNHVDLVFANEQEATALTNTKTAQEAAKALSHIVYCGVVKCGGRPSILFINKKLVEVPVYPVANLVDSTGAGDSFAAGFMTGITKYGIKDLKNINQIDEVTAIKATCLASVVASVVISRVGAQLSKEEAQELIKSLGSGPVGEFVNSQTKT